jgi:2'-5' RNA ligase
MKKLAERTSGVKWVEPENLHITLKFFSDIRVEETHEISRAVQKTIDEFDPFEIIMGGAGAFPNIEKPRAIWLGVTEGESQFREFFERLDDRLADLRYPPERRRFQPHLTIGRVRAKQEDGELTRLLAELDECYIGPSYIDEVVLFNSELERGEPVYTRIASLEF